MHQHQFPSPVRGHKKTSPYFVQCEFRGQPTLFFVAGDDPSQSKIGVNPYVWTTSQVTNADFANFWLRQKPSLISVKDRTSLTFSHQRCDKGYVTFYHWFTRQICSPLSKAKSKDRPWLPLTSVSNTGSPSSWRVTRNVTRALQHLW